MDITPATFGEEVAGEEVEASTRYFLLYLHCPQTTEGIAVHRALACPSRDVWFYNHHLRLKFMAVGGDFGERQTLLSTSAKLGTDGG